VPPEEVRKTVTVLFADVSGSTALGERLDPESLRRVMSRYFDAMRSVIERHGGTVEKFIGDAIMAVFGVPQLHEDDALRAVRAAAEMREALVSLNHELEREWGARLEIRTGVNTGRVVAGERVAGETLVTGDAVNVAARLEQSAESGDILLGRETFRLVRDAVQAEQVRELELKGKADPVAAYRLVEVRPGAPSFARRLDSPLVGRAGELDAVRSAFEEAVAGRSCRLVTVVGDAGGGKSRLAAELLAEAAGRSTILSGRCLPYGDGITFWPLAEALKVHAGVTERDSPEEARARIGALVEGTDDADLIQDRVAAAIGLDEGGSELRETFWAVRRVLEAVAGDRPLVLLVEDIHWAEPTLLDLLRYVVDFSVGRAVLLLCTTRPELREHRPDWERTGVTVNLEPLTSEQSAQLIENLLGPAHLPDEVRVRITDAAEGNPLFVEEMLRMLIDDGFLVRDNGHWQQGGDLSGVAIPGTIHALLSARLDRLDGEERAVIQRASVVGKVFWWGAVTELSPTERRDQVGTHLQTLLRKELIRPDRSTFVGEDAFRFSHILVRDAAYESMPKQTRAELHERFAGWLEGKAGDRIPEYEAILGYHLEQAFRSRAALGPIPSSAQALAGRAAGHLASAGRRAYQRGDMPAAVSLLGRAAELLPADDRTRPGVLTDLGAALTDVGELGRATDVFAEAVEAAAGSGDRRLEWHARVQSAWVRGSQDPSRDWKPLLTETEQAIEVFEELGDDAGLAKAWIFLAEFHNDLANRGEMEAAAARAVEHARRAGDRREEALSARLLGGALVYGPTAISEAVPRCEDILRRAPDSPMLEVAILPVLGALYGMGGRFEEGRALFDRARSLQEELGLRFLSARMALLLGDFEMLAREPAAAERECRRGCEIFQAMGETGRFSTLAVQLADALYALGRDEEALSFTEESEKASAPDDVVSQADWRRVRAKVLARRGETLPAEELVREALRVAEDMSQDDLHLRVKVLKDVGAVLRLAGRPAEGVPYVERALALEELKGNIAGAANARALLQELAAEGA